MNIKKQIVRYHRKRNMFKAYYTLQVSRGMVIFSIVLFAMTHDIGCSIIIFLLWSLSAFNNKHLLMQERFTHLHQTYALLQTIRLHQCLRAIRLLKTEKEIRQDIDEKELDAIAKRTEQKIYIIFNDSHECDGYDSPHHIIEYVSTNKEEALSYFDKHFSVLPNSDKWTYSYALYEFSDGYTIYSEDYKLIKDSNNK